MTYTETLKVPEWQKRRLEIFQRDNWKCTRCGCKDIELQVHHKDYFPATKVWEYPDTDLTTLCRPCHQKECNRSKHETYLIIALRQADFTADELLALSVFVTQFPGIAISIKKIISDAIENNL